MLRSLCVVLLIGLGSLSPVSADVDAPGRLTFLGCHTQFGGYPTTIDIARSLAPPGFEAAPFSLDPSGASGSWAIYLHRCADVQTDDGIALGPVQQAWVLLRVIPPAEWVDPDITTHFVVLNGVTDHALLSDTYAAWGLSANGTAVIDALPVGPDPVSAGQVGHVGGDHLAYDIVNAPTASSSPWGPFAARLYGVAADGSIHAADHVEPTGGRISQVEGTVATLDGRAGPLAGAHTGLGRVLAWPAGAVSWSVTPVASLGP